MKKTAAQPTSFFTKATQAYRRIFSVHEIENDTVLQWCFGILLSSLFFNLKSWSASLTTTLQGVRDHNILCWPVFQDCAKLIFLDLPPNSYSQLIFFNIFFTLMGASAFFIYRKNWLAAHLCLLIPYIARFYILIISASYGGNYWTYITYFGFIFLILPHKKFFAQLQVVMCYYLSSSSKISESWTLGAYFSNMQMGLPMVPRGIEIFLTNIVLFMEMAASWLLFSSNKLLQRSVLGFFIAFHIYSALIVGQTFPTIILPWVVLLFGVGFTSYQHVPLDRKSQFGWAFFACLVFFQLLPLLIGNNSKFTQEGAYYSLHMIDANNQCRYRLISGNTLISKRYSPGPEMTGSCSLYGTFSTLQNRYCPSSRPLRFVYEHSVNGSPFYRTVDELDFCSLKYKPYSHNAWMHDEKNSVNAGPARKSITLVNYVTSNPMMPSQMMRANTMPQDIDSNAPVEMTSLQQTVAPYIFYIHTFWWSLWWGLLAYLFSGFLLLKQKKR